MHAVLSRPKLKSGQGVPAASLPVLRQARGVVGPAHAPRGGIAGTAHSVIHAVGRALRSWAVHACMQGGDPGPCTPRSPPQFDAHGSAARVLPPAVPLRVAFIGPSALFALMEKISFALRTGKVFDFTHPSKAVWSQVEVQSRRPREGLLPRLLMLLTDRSLRARCARHQASQAARGKPAARAGTPLLRGTVQARSALASANDAGAASPSQRQAQCGAPRRTA